MSKEKILVTSALPYVNNVPHLGNIIGCVLSADVYARFCRSAGKETLFICGTDEHGTTTESKAIEDGVTPKEICDKYYKIHKEIYEWFNCSFDAFGRTSSKPNHEIAQDIFLKLDENGYILEQEIEQMYSEKSKMFLADRFVEGKCPHCGFEAARGDQCDSCGKLLNPDELVDPVSKIDGSTPIVKKVKHLFMDLPRIAPDLKKWIASRETRWSENARKMTSAWLRDGLRPRCITRDLKWGVKVPMKGYEDKVFYSWFDAPIGYIGITIDAFKDWKDWWKNDGGVKLVQFMGKDNIPFHTIMFPSFLIGSKDDYTLLYTISSTEYLNYESGKFSKSNRIGVFGDDAMNSGIPSDIFRYYLLYNRPETSDTEFSWDDFMERNNSELLANIGNFINRTLSFINSGFEGKIPSSELGSLEENFLKKLDSEIDVYKQLMEDIRLREGIRQLLHISRRGNQFFQENEPWKAIKEDKEKCSRTMYVCAEVVRKLAILLEPYLPDTHENIFAQLKLEPQKIDSLDMSLEEGHKIGKAKPIFRKLEKSEIESFRKRFSGKQIEKHNTMKDQENSKGEENMDDSDAELFGMLDLKVAEIEKVEEHPEADKLYVMQISLGEEKRQLVAGLKPYFPKEELQGRKIVVVANLKPAKLRGKESQGMLLAAEKHGKLALLHPKDSDTGSQVYVEGISPDESQITIDDFFKVQISTKGRTAVFQDKPLRTAQEESISADIDDGAKVR